MTHPDFAKPFIVQTDWSVKGMGAILSQLDESGHERVIAYASKSNSPSESRYSSYEGEMLAAVWAVNHWRYYLMGHHFTLMTDHQPLKWLMTTQHLTGKYARWALRMQEYDFDIVHRPGVQNPNADALSRRTDPTKSAPAHIPDITDFMPPLSGTKRPTNEGEKPSTTAATANLAEAASLPSYMPAHVVFSNSALYAPDEAGCAAALIASTEHPILWVNSAAAIAATAEAVEEDAPLLDIWEDEPVMHYLKTAEFTAEIPTQERDRINQRASRHRWDPELQVLYRILRDGTMRVIPHPADREAIVHTCHEKGHYGTRRTHHIVSLQYYWNGMWRTVREVVERCPTCDRVKASFNVTPASLNPLPIRALGYRWHIDLFGPLPASSNGYTYVMVCVEAFSKWAELVPLKDKSARTVRDAFLTHVLARFGAMAELVSDQGREYAGEFAELLEECLIDHRFTSRNHPQANGLAERTVQTIKEALRKCIGDGDKTAWEEFLPWIAMGYRMSRQRALQFSPYYIMFGREPYVPPAAVERLKAPLDLDCPELMVQAILQRAETIRKVMPIAFGNLEVAQHRDSLRYATTRTGGYKPIAHSFQEGDYVYLLTKPEEALDISASDTILRVVEVRGHTGVLILQGRDGRTVAENFANCAKCHRPDLDGTIDPSLAPVDLDAPCERCNGVASTSGNWMLICDYCNTGWHQKFLNPPYTGDPSKDPYKWYCPYCVKLGRAPATPQPANTAHAAYVASMALDQGRVSPQYVQTHSPQGVLRTLQYLMPGPWRINHATRLFNCLPGQKNFLQPSTGAPERVPTLPDEYTPLLMRVRWDHVSTVIDPWCGTGSTSQQLRIWPQSSHTSATLSDADLSVGAHVHGNALDATYLAQLRTAYGPFDVAITSPWFTMLDLALPLLMTLATKAVFCHVPGHYITNMPQGRRDWLRSLCTQRRAVVIANLPRSPMGYSCLWLCVFRSEEDREQLLHTSPTDEAVTLEVLM
jgi:transposase InsO family protein